jgi:hypothetical protein
MVFRDANAVYSQNNTRYINIHLPSDPKRAVKFPNKELCFLNNEIVRQTQIEVMKFTLYLKRT